MNINSPIKLSVYSDPKDLADVSDRNFKSLWQSVTSLIADVTRLKNKKVPEVISANGDNIILNINGKSYTIKTEG